MLDFENKLHVSSYMRSQVTGLLKTLLAERPKERKHKTKRKKNRVSCSFQWVWAVSIETVEQDIIGQSWMQRAEMNRTSLLWYKPHCHLINTMAKESLTSHYQSGRFVCEMTSKQSRGLVPTCYVLCQKTCVNKSFSGDKQKVFVGMMAFR